MPDSFVESKPWWSGAVVYQIWPRSFMDANGDGVGDLAGVIGRLDHLNDGSGGGLGVDAVWLSPFFASPMADYGYDISDYRAVDSSFGDLSDVDRLIEEASKRSLRVLLDLVPNHTSDQHEWFVDSRSSRHSPKRDWYTWRDGAEGGGPPNNWKSAFPGVGPAWTFDDRTGQYYLHSYTPSQPDLNWDNPAVRGAIKDVMRFWLDRGVSGFRIDVVHRLAKDPFLGDNPDDLVQPEPTGRGRRDADWTTIDARLIELREVADEYPHALLVGEVYILDQTRLVDYLGPGKLHLAHNFVFLNQPWSASALPDVIREFEHLAGGRVEGAWCLNNHDHSRVASRFGENGQAKARAAALLLMGLRGTVFIYQGEELGMEDTHIPAELITDIDGRDPVRTPIPWESPTQVGRGAGFTTGEPWLPIGEGADDRNVESERRADASMLNLYTRLISTRRASSALRHGGFRWLGRRDDLAAFARTHEAEEVLVVVNFGEDAIVLDDFLKEMGVTSAPSVVLGSSHAAPFDGLIRPFEALWITHEIPQKNS